jgi:N-sulfoglucosamine sulfohydrolase
VRDTDYPLDLLHDLVEKASWPSVDDVEYFTGLLSHDRPEIRYWATSGLAYLFQQGHYSQVPKTQILELLDDDFNSVSAIAGLALVYSGDVEKGMEALIEQGRKENGFAWSFIENAGSLARPFVDEINKIAKNTSNRAVAFSARSILINFGIMSLDQLIDKRSEEEFMKSQTDRVHNWKPTLP